MTWISLKGMKFKAPVGVYEEEKTNKNTIVVDLRVKVSTKEANSTDELAQTVDYQSLFEICRDVVTQGSNLLESVADKIISKVLREHPAVKKVKIKVKKQQPPVGGDCSFSEVAMKKKR